jgi:hypothetical protein
MKTYYLALDLHDDEKRIAEYEAYHENVSKEIIESITSSGINNMRLYRRKIKDGCIKPCGSGMGNLNGFISEKTSLVETR